MKLPLLVVPEALKTGFATMLKPFCERASLAFVEDISVQPSETEKSVEYNIISLYCAKALTDATETSATATAFEIIDLIFIVLYCVSFLFKVFRIQVIPHRLITAL